MSAKKSNEEDSLGLMPSEYEIQHLQQQLQMIKQQQAEISMIAESLGKLKELKKGDELLVAVGKGIFVKTKIEDADSVLMDVGSEVVVKKKLADAKNVIDTEVSQLKQYGDEFEQELNNLIVASKK